MVCKHVTLRFVYMYRIAELTLRCCCCGRLCVSSWLPLWACPRRSSPCSCCGWTWWRTACPPPRSASTRPTLTSWTSRRGTPRSRSSVAGSSLGSRIPLKLLYSAFDSSHIPNIRYVCLNMFWCTVTKTVYNKYGYIVSGWIQIHGYWCVRRRGHGGSSGLVVHHLREGTATQLLPIGTSAPNPNNAL